MEEYYLCKVIFFIIPQMKISGKPIFRQTCTHAFRLRQGARMLIDRLAGRQTVGHSDYRQASRQVER